MKYLLLIFLTGCTMNTASVQYGGGQDTIINRINHSDGESVKTVSAGVYKHYERFKYGYEFNYDTRADSFNLRVVGIYDLYQGRVDVFIGASGGVGHTLKDDYDLMSAGHGSYGMSGVCDLRGGLRYEIKKGLDLTLTYKLDHISRPRRDDPGSNCDVIMIGLEWRWK